MKRPKTTGMGRAGRHSGKASNVTPKPIYKTGANLRDPNKLANTSRPARWPSGSEGK